MCVVSPDTIQHCITIVERLTKQVDPRLICLNEIAVQINPCIVAKILHDLLSESLLFFIQNDVYAPIFCSLNLTLHSTSLRYDDYVKSAIVNFMIFKSEHYFI